jgi:hypothetical protein
MLGHRPRRTLALSSSPDDREVVGVPMPQMHVVTGDGLVPMSRAVFESEERLQELLASSPD